MTKSWGTWTDGQAPFFEAGRMPGEQSDLFKAGKPRVVA